MREIKFRAKTINTGNWVESMTIAKGTIKRKRDDYFFELDENRWVGVDAKTVGEFTGLNDKNGKTIYEGDIVEIIHPCWSATCETKFMDVAANGYDTDEPRIGGYPDTIIKSADEMFKAMETGLINWKDIHCTFSWDKERENYIRNNIIEFFKAYPDGIIEFG